MRIDKFLADMGVAKRSDVKKEIRAGNVLLDGIPVRDPGTHVPEGAEVLYRGEPVVYEDLVYYMMNKPRGVISATEDPRQETVLDLIGGRKRKGIFPVGRLDRDTEGLLLLTNDGALAHRLLSPRHHVDKVYFAEVSGRLTEEDVRRFAAGLRVDEELTALPAELEIVSARRASPDLPRGGWISEARITIREGKFHQIRRMFIAVGKEVLALKRLSMGPLALDESLAPGEYRRLTGDEIDGLRRA